MGEQKISNVNDGKERLNAVLGQRMFGDPGPGIVHQYVNNGILFLYPVPDSPDLLLGGEIDLEKIQRSVARRSFDIIKRKLSFFRIAAQH